MLLQSLCSTLYSSAFTASSAVLEMFLLEGKTILQSLFEKVVWGPCLKRRHNGQTMLVKRFWSFRPFFLVQEMREMVRRKLWADWLTTVASSKRILTEKRLRIKYSGGWKMESSCFLRSKMDAAGCLYYFPEKSYFPNARGRLITTERSQRICSPSPCIIFSPANTL